MDDPTTRENIAQTVANLATKLGDITPIDAGQDLHLFSVPTDRKISDLTTDLRKHAEYTKPHRRAGTAKMNDLPSIIAWANRNKGAESVIFADQQGTASASITVIADYHLEGAPDANPAGEATARHGKHRATYAFPMSRKWANWMALSGKAKSGPEMGQFLEDSILDVIDPPMSLTLPGVAGAEANAAEHRLIEIAQRFNSKYGSATQLFNMATSFAVYEKADFELAHNSTTGEGRVKIKSEHMGADGAPIDVPKLFLIAIPVFERGHVYRIPVRFQYRKTGGDLKFTLTLHDPERAFEDAFNEGCTQCATETGLPLFMGKPETL